MPGIVQTVVRAPESTRNLPQDGAGNTLRAIRDVAERIAYLDPDSAPLTVIMMRSNSRPARNWKFEWMEKSLPARWDAVNGAQTNTDTSIEVDNAKFFSIGDIVNNSRTEEKFLVTAVNTGTNVLTVVRAVDGDGVTGTAMNDNDDLQIIGNAYAEGAVSQTPKTNMEDWLYNHTQITRTPFGETGTEANTDNYTGKGRTVLRMEKGVEHRIDLERTALFGERAIFTSGNESVDNPRRYTGGILYFLTALSNQAVIKDFGGVVTEPELEDFMQNVFNPTGAGDSRTFVASPLWCSILDQLAHSRLQVVDRAETFGVTVRQLITTHGSLNVVKHRLLENNPVPGGGSPVGYAGHALALDFSRIQYRPLQNRATKLMTDIQANDYDGWKDEYMTECGWQIELAKVHGVAKGATA